MTQWTRTFKQNSNARPAWAAAVAAGNRLYEVGKRWDDAAHGVNAKLVFPEGTNGGGLYSGTDGTFSAFHDSYGGAVFVPDMGPHGAMVFGGTGEGIIAEQLAMWRINDDDPAWDVFQQPSYQLTAGAAASAGASWYYNPTEYAALPALKKIPWSAGTGSPEGAWEATWDRTFPIGRAGWIIPGLCGDSELGNSRPMAFRYNYPVYIPASMTGWGAGAIVINDRSWHGSFGGNSGPPLGVSAADWYVAGNVWPSGRKKHRLFAMNVVTRQWSVIGTIPDFVNSYIGNIQQPYAFVDVAAKRVYYTAAYAGHECLYYADFSAGAGAVTMSGLPVSLIESDGQADFSQSHSNADLFVGATGTALAGKKLYFFKNAFNRLGVIDLVGNEKIDLNVSSPPPAGNWIFSVDHANARVFITVKKSGTNTVTCTKFDIPSAHGTAGAYTLTTVSVDMNGITLEAAAGDIPYGSRGHYLDSLGGLVLLTQRYGKTLAFRPE
ncbi:MAG: hypothetical protein KA020_11580 [Planctomycetes bacterium]|nr:hypothetical protein [Planctomycetota bacterium]